MRIALFDVDAQLVQLARSAAQAKEHRVVLFCEPGDYGAEILGLFPSARLESDWESLLVGGEFEVLVVGRSQREITSRDELLRRSVQEGVPLVAVQPATESIVMHELAMIQKDTRSLLAPWNESREHPAARRLIELLRGKTISQIVFQRSLADASRPVVYAQLARDTGLLQSLAGTLDRVTALGPTAGEKLSSLAVTFAGQANALIQWVLQPAGQREGGKLSVNAEGQNYVLEIGPPDEPWKLSIETSSPTSASERESIAAEDAMLRSIQQSLAVEPTSPEVTDRWKDACHAAELAEGAQQSLRRGRTIQLHFEEHSEEQTFKSVMAVSGCLVLLLILMVLVLSAVIDALGLPFRHSAWWRLWPLYVLAPAVLLLAAQSLWRVFAAKNLAPARTTRTSHTND